MKSYTRKNIFLIVVIVFVALFFAIHNTAPHLALGATTTDGVNVTLTVDAAAEAAPAPAPPTGGGGPPGTPETLQILDVSVVAATSTAEITWTTNRPAMSVFSWGTTTEYTSGTISEISFTTEHLVIISVLSPDTLYHFLIEADDVQTGSQGYSGNFRTQVLPDQEPPANVIGFDVSQDDEAVRIVWENPPDEDFDFVRIVRSEDFFPLTPFDGQVVYEGRGTETTDADVETGVTYYYSIFARDTKGNFSEGGIDSIQLTRIGVPPRVDEPFEEFPPAPPSETHPLIEALTLFHIDFIQNEKRIPYLDLRAVPINGSKNLTVSIEYDLLPEILKTVGVTVVDPEDPEKTFSFLLRVSPDKGTYQTTLAPFGRSGEYRFVVHILDHRNQALKKLEGKMLVAAAIEEIETVGAIGLFLQAFVRKNICFSLLIALCTLFLIVRIFAYFKSEEKEKKKKEIIWIVLIVTIITASFFLRGNVPEKYFCVLFFTLLFLLFVKGILSVLRRRRTNHADNKKFTQFTK